MYFYAGEIDQYLAQREYQKSEVLEPIPSFGLSGYIGTQKLQVITLLLALPFAAYCIYYFICRPRTTLTKKKKTSRTNGSS